MKTVLLTCIVLVTVFFAVSTAHAGKKVKIKAKEETLLGIVSCTVAAPKPPTLIPGPNGVPQVLGADGTPVAPGTSVVPQPINTVRDCLAKGGQILFHPDGGRADMTIENPELVKGHEWHRVSISGYPNGALFHIMSLRQI